jgi:hypothetical protein
MKNRKNIITYSILLVIAILGLLIILNWSSIGSKLANPMRQLLGVERVAQIETLLFRVQDRIEQWKFQRGLSKPENPWQDAQSISSPSPAPTDPVAVLPSATSQVSLSTTATTPEVSKSQVSTPTAQLTPTSAVTPTPTAWTLASIPPFGDMDGEGVWVPYIYNSAGEVVALRTFLQPDPERPYSLAAIVAFDLTRTRLHFVLGLEEPGREGGPHGYGVIPAEDKVPGKLLAAFNGGFIAEHGAYGAMANGVMPLAGSAGLATLGIYKDGSVKVGEWKTDLFPEEDWEAWRQNAPSIIHNGLRNPAVDTGNPFDWGANLDGATVTLRSGVGLNEDNTVLYYFAGPKLSTPVLADAMQAVGVHNGMLLDINPTHAHFTAMRSVDGNIVPEPLYEEEMNVWVDRYLRQWSQDFFYVTEK